ncbi:MAG: hypothetical protein IPM46_02800 [Flavobacteriales bacterium]|nr:hypothetical protein [Flavobacteriales bacterium]
MNLPHSLKCSSLVFVLFAFITGTVQSQKQVIDEELLSSIVQAKQEEIKARALTNLVRGNVRTLNKTTFNTIYDMVDILLTEKNKTVMTRGLVGKASDYALSYAATRYLMKTQSVFQGASDLKGLAADKVAEKLGDAYEKAQKHGSWAKRGNPLSIGKVDPVAKPEQYIVAVDNWLLDQMYIALSKSTKLRGLGFFKVESARSWQYDTLKGADVDYVSLWDNNTAERKRLIGLIDGFKTWLETNLNKLDQVAKSVEDLDWSALNQINLTKLAQAPGTVGNAPVGASIKLFLKAVDLYRHHVGQNATLVRIADIITDYIIFEPEEKNENGLYGFSIDVEGIILSFEDKIIRSSTSPTKRSWFNLRPFFTIGLNYGYFSSFDSAFTASESLGISQVAWAGEKIGVKWYLWDWKYTRGQQANEPYRFHGRMWTRDVRPRDPILSNWYLSLYASGMLYTIADLRSESNFNSAIIGTGTGVRFFNGLELNVSYAAPVLPEATVQENIDAGFWNVGLDIPIFEYIRAARAKRGQ